MTHSFEHDPAGGQAALAERVRSLCVAAIFALAGVSEVVELLFNLSAGRVDTHVLMTLACFGTLAIGSGLEARCLQRLHFKLSLDSSAVQSQPVERSTHAGTMST